MGLGTEAGDDVGASLCSVQGPRDPDTRPHRAVLPPLLQGVQGYPLRVH